MFYSIGDQIHHRMTCSFYAGLLEQVGASEFVKEIESLSMEVLLSRRLVVEVEVKIINGEINVEEKVFHIHFLKLKNVHFYCLRYLQNIYKNCSFLNH